MAKYRYFYTEGVKAACRQGLTYKQAGCFYRSEGRGAAAILGALGRTFMDAHEQSFNNNFIEDVEDGEHWDGNIHVDYQGIE
jgi:hypothetical protein